ncbi:MAG: alpha-E domain-containing protein [Gemmatimonadota bacterium]|nr:alpha-E domain-containing protein [Gemmatimonadota bacterium]MXX13977.1 alpha-E domain-containing protein [Gemmatimonadota bacterium]MYB58175.1 alpha-E domain-containing protein [Gemmatimonadota bacterium]
MLSRAAESIYWMSRYLERAENVARFIQVNCHLMLDLPVEAKGQWEPLVLTTGDQDLFYENYATDNQASVIDFLTFSPVNPNSIISCLQNARENARSIREIISTEMWEQINKFYLQVQNIDKPQAQDAPHDYFTDIIIASHLFTGIQRNTLSHNEAWQFAQLGRDLECADKTSRILDVKYYFLLPEVGDVGTPFDNIQWSALLKSASALEMYRKQYGPIEPHNVVDFLLLNREFPRAIRYCLSRANQSLHTISGTPESSFQNTSEQVLGRLLAELDYTSIDEIITRGLHEYLDAFQTRLNRLDNAIFETFFATSPSSTTA